MPLTLKRSKINGIILAQSPRHGSEVHRLWNCHTFRRRLVGPLCLRFTSVKPRHTAIEGGVFGDAAPRDMQIRKAREDIKYDFLHGYILFPQYKTTNSPSHFVNAGEIVLMANVMNIKQLYSEEEMDQARQVAEAEKASEATRKMQANKITGSLCVCEF